MKRRAIKFAIATALGVVLTFAVAWFPVAVPILRVMTGRSFAFMQSTMPTTLPMDRTNELINAGLQLRPAFPTAVHRSEFIHAPMHRYEYVVLKDTPFTGRYCFVGQDSNGWPCYALQTRFTREYPYDRQYVTSVPYEFAAGSTTVLVRFPYGFIWRGFLINTLVFTCMSYAMLSVPWNLRRARRKRRTRRGACLACGYDLRHDYTQRCPECGWKRDQVETPRIESRGLKGSTEF